MIFSVICIIIGAPCWGVGANNSGYMTTQSLISVPLFPMTADKLGLYGAAVYNGSAYYPDQNEYNITINAESIYRPLSDKMKLYLFHNLWGLNASLTVKSGNSIVATKNFSFNTNDENVDENAVSSMESIKGYASDFEENGASLTYCPYSTLITLENDIDTLCKSGKYPMKIPGKFSSLIIMENDFDEVFNLTFEFSNLQGLPRNFIEIPQLYIGGFKETSKDALIITGIVFVMIGLVFAIIDTIVFIITQL